MVIHSIMGSSSYYYNTAARIMQAASKTASSASSYSSTRFNIISRKANLNYYYCCCSWRFPFLAANSNINNTNNYYVRHYLSMETRATSTLTTTTTLALSGRADGGKNEFHDTTARMSHKFISMIMAMGMGGSVMSVSSSSGNNKLNSSSSSINSAQFSTTAHCEKEQQQQQRPHDSALMADTIATSAIASTTNDNPNSNNVNLTRRLTIRRDHHDSNHSLSSSSSSPNNGNQSSTKIGDPFPLCQPPPRNKEVVGPKGIPSRMEQVRKLKLYGAGVVGEKGESSGTTVGGAAAAASSSHPTQQPYYDILVIGGGATGAGIAFDAVTRTRTDTTNVNNNNNNDTSSSSSSHTPPTLKVACIERGDFSSETSSRSTKLIWAGIKYLASASSSLLSWKLLTSPLQTMQEFYEEFQMVRSCAKERQYMLEKQAHLTNWIPIVCPFTQWHIWPPPFGHWLFSFFPLLAPMVFKFYDGLSGFTCPPSFVMGSKSCRRQFPQLNEQDIKYCAVFYEGQHNDARTNLAIALSAAEYGADIANYVEMIEAIFSEEGNVVGVKALDRITGEIFPIYAKHVIFAGGPFTDALRQLENGTDQPVPAAVMAASGSHIVLPGYYAPPDMGLLDYNTSDGRFLFLLPWQGSVIVGTTDKKGPAETLPYPPEEEILWMLKECEKYLSNDLKVRRSDVLSAWRGWRPLAVDPHASADSDAIGAPQQVSRDHVISTNPKTGVTFIAGGKWTTWREMAEDTLDHVLGGAAADHPQLKCNTLDIVLHGGEGYSESLSIQLIQKYGLMEDVAEHLARTYGGRVWEVLALCKPTGKQWPRYGTQLVSSYPYIEEEIRYACREYACTIEDILSRRTRLAFLNSEAAFEALPRVADIMAEELGWSRKVKQSQMQSAKAYLESYGGRIPVDVKDDFYVRLPTLEEAMDIFHDIDIEKSGSLNMQQVKEIVSRLGQQQDEGHIKTIFNAMDRNRDGKVDEKEFMEWFSNDETREGIKSCFHQRVTQMFNEIDIDNSGYLTEQELKDISIQLGQELSTKKIKAIFKEMDANMNGKIELDEFIAWMDKEYDETGFRKMLSASMGLGGIRWLDKKHSGGSFLG